MKILVLTSTYSRWLNDTEPKFVDNLCQQLSTANTVHVIAPHAPGIPVQETLDGIPVHRFRYGPARWQTLAYEGGILPNIRNNPLRILLVPTFLLGQWLLVIRLLRRHDYDVIHAHWIIPQGLVAVLARNFARRKPALVMTSHGGDLFALKGPILSRLKTWITRRADVLTVVSSAMNRRAAELGLQEADSILTIPMGVDSYHTFYPADDSGAREGLLFVGRLVDKKGIEYLIQAMPEVLQAHPDAHLNIVGDGPLKPALSALVKQLGLEARVSFLGSLPNTEIPHYLQHCAAAIFPSVVTDSGDQEGTPVAIMESLACACPTIASDYPGVRDIITDGETGLIVAQKSPVELAAAISSLLNNHQSLQALGSRGREWVQEHYDWRVISARFSAVFESLSTHNESQSTQK